MFVIGLAIGPLLGLITVTNMFKAAILLVVLVTALYFYTKQSKWVYLSSEGIKGYSPSGMKVSISWAEEMKTNPISAYSGIKGLALKSSKSSRPLFLPLAIASSSEFQSKLAQLTPENHPLRGIF